MKYPSNFIALSEKKADLVRFISQQLIVQAPTSKVIIVASGFTSDEMVESSCSDVDTVRLEAQHEEANNRMIFHCVENHTGKIVVQSRDTDVLALLLGHYHRMTCTQLRLKTGTAKNRHYIPTHDIMDHIPYKMLGRALVPTR